jgi:hypothetical protein
MKRNTKHKEVIKAWLDGATIEHRYVESQEWRLQIEQEDVNWFEDSQYRVQPEVLEVDMSLFVDSVLDMQFTDTAPKDRDTNLIWLTDKLIKVLPGQVQHKYVGILDNFEYCQPRFNHWNMVLDGGFPPVMPDGILAEYRHISRVLVAIKITGLENGYKLPDGDWYETGYIKRDS